jgi:hypothetical protein
MHRYRFGVLERLLGGVSPAARRGITIALIAIAWAGFLIAVFSGLAAGILFIVFGFALCWFAASMLGAKSGTVHEPEPGAAPPEPDDVETRVRKRLESMQGKPEDEGPDS